MPDIEQIPTPATPPAPPIGDFIDTPELLRRLPVCRKTLNNWRQANKLPYIQAGGRRVLYHWPSVQNALLRQQRGGCA
jgi:hypothetical protein